MAEKTANKKRMTGLVIKDKMNKSRVVVVEHKMKHPTYKKYLKTRKRFMVHDEENKTKRGHTVIIQDTSPLSTRKRWEIVEVLGHTELEEEEATNGNAGN